MRKNLFKHFLLIIVIAFCFLSCSKNTEDINPVTHFTFTPSEWSTWLGKDWTTISPNLKSMTGFTIKRGIDTVITSSIHGQTIDTTIAYENYEYIKIPIYDINEPIQKLWLFISYTSTNKIRALNLFADSSSNPILIKNKEDAYNFAYYNCNQIFSTNDIINMYAKYQYGIDSLIDGTPNVSIHSTNLNSLLNIFQSKNISLNQATAISTSPTFNTVQVGLVHLYDSNTKDSVYLSQIYINSVY